jgi:hypothetical protein
MKRRNAFAAVLLTVGLVVVVAGVASNDAHAQLPGGYLPNGYLPNRYLPNGYSSTGIVIPGGFGSNEIAIPGGFGNGGIAWSWAGADDEEEPEDDPPEVPNDEEDLGSLSWDDPEIEYYFMPEGWMYDKYPPWNPGTPGAGRLPATPTGAYKTPWKSCSGGGPCFLGMSVFPGATAR